MQVGENWIQIWCRGYDPCNKRISALIKSLSSHWQSNNHIHYNTQLHIMGVLTIYLEKATNLKDEDHIGKSDPYIKFSLEQDNNFRDKDYGYQKSTTKEGNLNPVYEETFTFQIPTLDNMELEVKVMDDDIGSDEKMGKSKIKLEKLGLSETPMSVEEKVYNRIFGKDSFVHLQLSYKE